MPSVAQPVDALHQLRQGPAYRARGLENQSGANHCFLNVVIQALWNLQSFRKRLLQAPCHTHSHAASSCSAFARLAGNDQCCYCALKSLFHEFAVSDRDVLPPDALRKALSLAYTVQGRFQTGDMEDATETIEVILGILHACSLSSSLAPSASPRAQCVHAEFIEEASRFGCHPPCLSHEVFGVEYVDVPRCTFCGATGEPTVTSAFTYGVYVTELLECREDLAGQVHSEGAMGLWQSIHLVPATRRASLQQVLRKLCQLRGGNCSECNSRHTLATERFFDSSAADLLVVPGMAKLESNTRAADPSAVHDPSKIVHDGGLRNLC
mmetsp:Transcript_44944/g.92957  ORF Transcript_44944/g.92957 Transcript_44944/m.92957 type:complete len:324 (+) Transcript_44944:129-1100(+)